MTEATSSARPDLHPRTLAYAAGLTLAMAVVLWSMGRTLWCACGGWNPWSSDVWSSHNSQHLADPYALSHLLHGVLFFGALRLLLGAGRLQWRFGIAMTLEALWEIAENTPMVIDRYRESTVSLDYFGDSIVNSVGDLWSCALGFWIALRVPWQVSVGLFVLTELVLLGWIRDSLTVNVIMLIHPVEAIKEWQLAGATGQG